MAAGLPGTFKARVSNNALNPANRFVRSSDPYVLGDGTQVASDWSTLVDGSLDNAINMDEFGNLVDTTNATNRVWTATGTAGTRNFFYCLQWTNNSTGSTAHAGFLDAVDSTWTQRAARPRCNQYARLYCFQQRPLCACNPSKYRFTLNFAAVCPTPGSNFGPETGIGFLSCGTNRDSAVIPVSINRIIINEYDQKLQAIKQFFQEGLDLRDGDTFDFTSSIAENGPDIIPGAMAMVLTGADAQGGEVTTQWFAIFTNKCDVLPFEEGNSLGWATFVSRNLSGSVFRILELGSRTCYKRERRGVGRTHGQVFHNSCGVQICFR